MKRRIAKVLTTFGLAAGLAVAPFAFQDGSVLLDGHQALAKPGGGNNGNGGNGNGNGHSKDNGKGHSKGHGVDKDKSKKSGYAGVGSNLKGAFNAVHASPTAMSNAAPTSQVGAVKGYLDAVSADEIDIETAAEAAVEAAKGKAIDFGMLDAVHEIGDVEVADATTHEIADTAAELQAGNLEGEDGDGEGEEGAVDGGGEGEEGEADGEI